MENNNKILQELKEISPLLIQFENKTFYTVPFSYFDGIAGSVMERIKTAEELAHNFSKKIPYCLPDGYFENLSATITGKIKVAALKNEVHEELEAIAPFLNTLSKNSLYNVPDKYFEEQALRERNEVVEPAKVVSLFSAKKVLQYVAAAVIIGLLAIGGLLFVGNQKPAVQANQQAVAEVKALTEQEIEDFLKTTSPTESMASVGGNTNIKDNDIRRSVSSISDNEIEEFLQENGEQGEQDEM